MTAIPILMYHSIHERSSPAFRPWTVPPGLLATHLDHLARHGYQALTVGRLAASMSGVGAPLPPRPVVITFDDGFADFHQHALPLLERVGMSATLYVTTGLVGGTASWLTRLGEGQRRMLTWSQVAEVASSGIECGAHSVSHPRLDELPTRRARAEIRASRAALEDRLGVPVTTFAYPHGYHGSRISRLVAEAGYDSAVGVRHAMSSPDDDVLGLARIIVGPDTDEAGLGRLLSGAGLRRAPFPELPRTRAWRAARRTTRFLAQAGHGGAAGGSR